MILIEQQFWKMRRWWNYTACSLNTRFELQPHLCLIKYFYDNIGRIYIYITSKWINMAYYGLRTAWEPMQQLLIPGRFEQQCKAKSMARCLTSLAWNGTLANLLGIIWRPNKNRKQIYEIIIVEEKLKFKASDIGTLSCVCFFFQTLGSWIMLFLCVWDLRCFSLILLLNLKFDEYTCCQRKRIFGLDPQVIRGHRPTNNAKLVPNAGSERIWWTRWALLVISRVITTINGLIHG